MFLFKKSINTFSISLSSGKYFFWISPTYHKDHLLKTQIWNQFSIEIFKYDMCSKYVHVLMYIFSNQYHYVCLALSFFFNTIDDINCFFELLWLEMSSRHQTNGKGKEHVKSFTQKLSLVLLPCQLFEFNLITFFSLKKINFPLASDRTALTSYSWTDFSHFKSELPTDSLCLRYSQDS